jgi:hypothetical protein
MKKTKEEKGKMPYIKGGDGEDGISKAETLDCTYCSFQFSVTSHRYYWSLDSLYASSHNDGEKVYIPQLISHGSPFAGVEVAGFIARFFS